MLAEFIVPVVYAIFLWWFATGGLFLLNALDGKRRRFCLVLATALAGLALYGLIRSGQQTGIVSAYLSFTCGLALWGWQTLTYYTGFITGPREQACPPHATGWQRFGYGLAASLWHELVALATALLLLVVCWHLPNRVGLWTYGVLWSMHVSAKLNLFLGVRNTGDDFLPTHLSYLKSFFRRRRMNPLFPVSLTVGSLLTALFVDAAVAVEASAFTTAGSLLIATLSGLAVLEHACLFLPIPAALLWRWTQSRRHDDPTESTDPHRSDAWFVSRRPSRGRL